jgi:hypothetical protein
MGCVNHTAVQQGEMLVEWFKGLPRTLQLNTKWRAFNVLIMGFHFLHLERDAGVFSL